MIDRGPPMTFCGRPTFGEWAGHAPIVIFDSGHDDGYGENGGDGYGENHGHNLMKHFH